MTWQRFKAQPHERKYNKHDGNITPRLCRICGKPTDNGSHTCRSCREFLKEQATERSAKENEH
ncbi:hypothetical protein [Butyrivibrio sp. WCD2001]|uniref:hypothetical protein n=1 Tax=Butyrivibrio sp. WCD2001 TaxID=1280681 RepID=UPI00047D34B4|nr:hypothetical protein [Butyrivibrio sp. WCD2001]